MNLDCIGPSNSACMPEQRAYTFGLAIKLQTDRQTDRNHAGGPKIYT